MVLLFSCLMLTWFVRGATTSVEKIPPRGLLVGRGLDQYLLAQYGIPCGGVCDCSAWRTPSASATSNVIYRTLEERLGEPSALVESESLKWRCALRTTQAQPSAVVVSESMKRRRAGRPTEAVGHTVPTAFRKDLFAKVLPAATMWTEQRSAITSSLCTRCLRSHAIHKINDGPKHVMQIPESLHSRDSRRGLLLAMVLYIASWQPLFNSLAYADEFCANSDDDNSIVSDTAAMFSDKEYARLVRILRTGEAQTGVRIRVLTRRFRSPPWVEDPNEYFCRLGLNDRQAQANSILLIGDRTLLTTGSFLRLKVGPNINFSLPPIFFTRLRQEYGTPSFIEKRGEAASLVASIEIILTCLRSEDGYCTDVPLASTYF